MILSKISTLLILTILEYQLKIRGWVLGTIDGKTPGVIPANYLKIMGKKAGENSTNLDKSES